MKIKSAPQNNVALTLLICLLIVAGTSKGLVLAGEHWRGNQLVLAEELSPLPDQVNQHQLTEMLNDGYLGVDLFNL
ncbi:MAG: hypothetical protein WCV73_01595 [Patescibacteria group bacterium]|jgi:hypothetical protein